MTRIDPYVLIALQPQVSQRMSWQEYSMLISELSMTTSIAITWALTALCCTSGTDLKKSG